MSNLLNENIFSFFSDLYEIFGPRKMNFQLIMGTMMLFPLVVYQPFKYYRYRKSIEENTGIENVIPRCMKSYALLFFKNTKQYYLVFFAFFVLRYSELKCVQRTQKKASSRAEKIFYFCVSSVLFVALIAVFGISLWYCVYFLSKMPSIVYALGAIAISLVFTYYVGRNMQERISLACVLFHYIVLILEFIASEQQKDMRSLFTCTYGDGPKQMAALTLAEYKTNHRFKAQLTSTFNRNIDVGHLGNVYVYAVGGTLIHKFQNSSLRGVCISPDLLNFNVFTKEMVISIIVRELHGYGQRFLLYYNLFRIFVELFTIFIAYAAQKPKEKYYIKAFNIAASFFITQHILGSFQSAIKYFCKLEGDFNIERELKSGLIDFLIKISFTHNTDMYVACIYDRVSAFIFNTPSPYIRISQLDRYGYW
ncbi:hypothetical protein ENBRE01_1387 [Enteropsectra breve]|nr:hypothetical protein ENBRE01_1387 [Enteropsectra breve]